MGSSWLFLTVIASCTSSLLAQNRPEPHLVSEIYNNAPPIIQAALRNVGFTSTPRMIKTKETRRSNSPSLPASQTNHRSLPRAMVASPSVQSSRSLQQQNLPVSPKITNRQSHDSIRRGEPPYVLIRPLTVTNNRNSHSKSKGRIVLALPNDNIQILNAETVSEHNRGTNIIPSTLTLSLRDPKPDSEEERYGNNQKNNYNNRVYSSSTTKTFASQIPTPPHRYHESRNHQNPRNRNLRYQYGFVPLSQDDGRQDDDYEESNNRYRSHDSSDEKGDVSFEDYDDLISSGGQVTVIKAQKSSMPKILQARKVSGRSFEPMKAIFIEPEEIKAKRVTVVKSDTRKVMPMKATLLKTGALQPVTAMKAKAHPVQFKAAALVKAKTHRQDRSHAMGASNIHSIKVDPQQMETGDSRLLGDPGVGTLPGQDNEVPPIDLQCGGNNDLGWCDLGPHYPISEVSQIMEVCEELVSRMYVEIPVAPETLEDILSYSLSHNITDHFSRRWDKRGWNWDGKPPVPMQGLLCDVDRNYIRPSFAQDIRGKWHVVIQTDKFPQRVPLEVCRNPGESCHQSEVCSQQSQCVQKYTYQHLISFDPESAETCPFVRLYKFPTSCVCRIPRKSAH